MWELADATGATSPTTLLGVAGLICAALSLACTFVGAVGQAPRLTAETVPPREHRPIQFAWSAALLLAVPPTVLVMVALVGRGVRGAIALLVTGPAHLDATVLDHALLSNRAGLATAVLLSASALVGLRARRDDRLAAAHLWSLVLLATWACSAIPVFEPTPSGSLARTPATLWLMAAWCAIVLAAWSMPWARRPAAPIDSARGNRVPVRSLTALVFGTSILICYHLAVPIRVETGGFRTGMMLAAACGLAAAFSASALCRIRWDSHLAESALVAGSLGVCAVCALVIPEAPVAPARRLPFVFAAVVVGLACASLTWTSIGRRLRRGDSLPGLPQPLADRFRSLVIRSAFYCAAAATLVSAIMAVWPRFPGVATVDDTLGRFALGIATDLWLLLVLVVGARHERRPTFHLLALLTLVSTGAFVAVRLWPYAHKVGQAALP
jgi:hypothetical protein